jgi:hypothetical protein
MRLVMMACLIGCVEAGEPMQDAGVATLQIDACVREPSGDCCTLLPDMDAVGRCIKEQLADTVGCGVYVCWSADCQLTRIPFCVGQ